MHTGAVTKELRAYAWGSGCHGQLGIGVVDHAQVSAHLVATNVCTVMPSHNAHAVVEEARANRQARLA
jgi:alpha-tubulin suppressor-like RCC1 family protein